MKPNINDLPKLPELKKVLSEKKVSNVAISTIEKALKKGMVFKKPDDLAILNIPTADLSAIGEFVDFGNTIEVVQNLKRLEYKFHPIGDKENFYEYQLIVTYINRESFTIEQAYP